MIETMIKNIFKKDIKFIDMSELSDIEDNHIDTRFYRIVRLEVY